MKKKQMIGALSYIVLKLAYEYQLYIDFQKDNRFITVETRYPWRQVNEWIARSAHDSKRKAFIAEQKAGEFLFKERLLAFGRDNDFVLEKLNTFIFMLITVDKKETKYLLDFFTDIPEGFYFQADSSGIKNTGLESLMCDEAQSYLFHVWKYGVSITGSASSSEDLRRLILQNSFSEDIENGEKILVILDRNLSILSKKFNCIANMTVDVCRYHIRHTFSYKMYKEDPLKDERAIEYFYEIIFRENFAW